jgi:hypothetical protein
MLYGHILVLAGKIITIIGGAKFKSERIAKMDRRPRD